MTDAVDGPEEMDRSNSMLIAGSAVILQSLGYWTEPVALPDNRTLLLAENDYFALGLTEFGDGRDLPYAEASASAGLVDRLLDAKDGAKRWDLYLVLMTAASQSGDDMPESVTSIVYNTRYLRRIVRWDLTPETHVLTRALQAFLPLPTPPRGRVAAPIDLLASNLPQFGVSPDAADLAVRQWRESSSRD